jgi:hypothetical protein
MNEFRTRVRAVRFKSGGELRLMPSAREEASRRTADRLRKDVELAIDSCPDELAGFALTVWLADGSIFSSIWLDKTSTLTTPQIPTIVADSVRKVLTGVQINRALGRGDDESA